MKLVRKYAKTIRNFFKDELLVFDLILLGLGENGHTASLFPGSKIDFDTKGLVTEVYVEEQKMWRVTMPPLLINQASNIVFPGEGESKATILSSVLNGPYLPNVHPAQLIKPGNGTLTWFADSKAAALQS